MILTFEFALSLTNFEIEILIEREKKKIKDKFSFLFYERQTMSLTFDDLTIDFSSVLIVPRRDRVVSFPNYVVLSEFPKLINDRKVEFNYCLTVIDFISPSK